jgi:3-isopropylmalate dehydrogenase
VKIALEYPDITVDDFHIDAMTVHLVRRGHEFDVLVTENMFGDILSDLAGELAGSLGIAPSLNASQDRAMAQAAHGSAPDIAGRDLANPTAMILSTAMLLEWLGARHEDEALTRAAHLIEESVAATLARGTSTRDMGGSAGCREFAETVAASIGQP